MSEEQPSGSGRQLEDDPGRKKMLPRMKKELMEMSEMLKRRRKRKRMREMLEELDEERRSMLRFEIFVDEEEDEEKYWRKRYREDKLWRDRDRDRDGDKKRKPTVYVSPPLVLTTEEQVLLDRLLVNPVILATVFSFLPPSDVASAALVCSTWREALQAELSTSMSRIVPRSCYASNPMP